MAQLTDVFPFSNLTFHEKDGARHEFRPTAEYLYNATQDWESEQVRKAGRKRR